MCVEAGCPFQELLEEQKAEFYTYRLWLLEILMVPIVCQGQFLGVIRRRAQEM